MWMHDCVTSWLPGTPSFLPSRFDNISQAQELNMGDSKRTHMEVMYLMLLLVSELSHCFQQLEAISQLKDKWLL